MSAHGHTAELTHEHAVGTTKLFATVWVWLLLLTIVEVYLGLLAPGSPSDDHDFGRAFRSSRPR